MEKILILGSGGHAKSVIDAIERENKYEISGLVINDDAVDEGGYPIIGNDDDLDNLFRSGIVNAAVGIGYLGKSDLREKIYARLKKIGFNLPIICDPTAIIAKHVDIGEGSFIGKGAVINSYASIGRMCIINSASVIEHDCKIDDFSHVSVSSVLCGGVNVGKASFIGANSTVIQMKNVGDRCIIGAGTVIKDDVEDAIMIHGEKTKYLPGGGISNFLVTFYINMPIKLKT